MTKFWCPKVYINGKDKKKRQYSWETPIQQSSASLSGSLEMEIRYLRGEGFNEVSSKIKCLATHA